MVEIDDSVCQRLISVLEELLREFKEAMNQRYFQKRLRQIDYSNQSGSYYKRNEVGESNHLSQSPKSYQQMSREQQYFRPVQKKWGNSPSLDIEERSVWKSQKQSSMQFQSPMSPISRKYPEEMSNWKGSRSEYSRGNLLGQQVQKERKSSSIQEYKCPPYPVYQDFLDSVISGNWAQVERKYGKSYGSQQF